MGHKTALEAYQAGFDSGAAWTLETMPVGPVGAFREDWLKGWDKGYRCAHAIKPAWYSRPYGVR